ncbi:zinc finger protein [Tokyovirus A1]|uniref:zinc finger protein n=1 Tax=Tokyovirus A1 TaxID=1826170 RepID=UPI0007A96703|nr:zinc finger protein [Tokyovirus A1]BAU80240.1 zinc finger protein [Tokyovirus A1]
MFTCEPCCFMTKDISNYKKHLSTKKHERLCSQDSADHKEKYFCETCSYFTDRKSCIDRHLSSEKHKKKVSLALGPNGKKACLSEDKLKKLLSRILESKEEDELRKIKDEDGRKIRVKYVVKERSSLVKDRISYFEWIKGVLEFFEVKARETEGGFFVTWRTATYMVSRKDFFVLSFELAVGGMQKSQRAASTEYENIAKRGGYNIPATVGRIVGLINQEKMKMVVYASPKRCQYLIIHGKETLEITDIIRDKKLKFDNLSEGFCRWWASGEHFKNAFTDNLVVVPNGDVFPDCETKRVKEKIFEGENFIGEDFAGYSSKCVIDDEKYVAFLDNFSIKFSQRELHPDIKAVKALRGTLFSFWEETQQKKLPLEAYGAVQSKKEQIEKNIIYSHFGIVKRIKIASLIVSKFKDV